MNKNTMTSRAYVGLVDTHCYLDLFRCLEKKSCMILKLSGYENLSIVAIYQNL